MIVSASYRTDIPAFYAAWFRARWAAGFARVVNPYGGPSYEVALRGEAVDGYVFWTRNIAPFRDNLRLLRDAGQPFMVQYTLTGYPRALESRVVEQGPGIAAIKDLAAEFGRRCVVWRYDPIVFTSLTEAADHRRNFAALAAGLAGSVDEVCLSFANIYRKSRRNLDASARRHGFTWRDPAWDEKRSLRLELEAIAADHGLTVSVCSQAEAGGAAARCIDAERLSDLAGRSIKVRRKGNRPACLCAESRDIGAYDSCPHGCAYCYAVRDRDRAAGNYRRHDPTGECLNPSSRAGLSSDGTKGHTPALGATNERR
ncbi:MAG: DUF1848 family protein [Alphaproteobacteria bacterium]|nr:DUF1848 family protein [Alphaproteobacteria bacterium]MDP6565116.1 DUF1848 family protein [Alphaproteobacteria bacterium]MDP6815147.1 DUF1848 family protein [Alphaproteobacteria bacterium]